MPKTNRYGMKVNDAVFVRDMTKNDIICLSEIDCSNDQDICIQGYNCFKLCRPITNKINRFLVFIAIYYGKEMIEGIKFLEHKNDHYVWIKRGKYCFNMELDYYICYAYIPPQNWYIENDIVCYCLKVRVILCGDLNI